MGGLDMDGEAVGIATSFRVVPPGLPLLNTIKRLPYPWGKNCPMKNQWLAEALPHDYRPDRRVPRRGRSIGSLRHGGRATTVDKTVSNSYLVAQAYRQLIRR